MAGVVTNKKCEECGENLVRVDREIKKAGTNNFHLRYFRCQGCNNLSLTDEQMLENMVKILHRIGYIGTELFDQDLKKSQSS